MAARTAPGAVSVQVVDAVHDVPADGSVAFQVDVRRADPGIGHVTVFVFGELDRETSVQVETTLRRHLRPCLDTGAGSALGYPAAVVVLDLGGVTYLNAGGLQVLAAAREEALIRGVDLQLRPGTRSAVLRPLQITGLLSVFSDVA